MSADVIFQELKLTADQADHPIFEAALSGDLLRVKAYIADGADINLRQKGGSTPLIAASWGATST